MSTFTKWEVYAIAPKAGENLITNPSIEAAITGYTAVNSALAVSSTYARYGTNSLRVTPSDANAAGAYWSAALTDTLTYTFSLSIKGEAGKTYTMAFIDDTGAAVEASLQFTATGNWQRKSVTFTADETDTFYLQLLRDAGQATTAAFYTDGWQLEVGAAMTTYIDGTLDSVVGMLRGRTEYYWTGAQHASTSKRVEWTASGGELVKLSSYCRILSIVGLGLPQISPIAADISTGGGLYQWSRAGNRDFQLVVSFSGTNPGEVARDVAAVQNALDITAFWYNQPLRLMLVGYDASGVIEQSETIWVDCAYTGGLEGSFSNYHFENRVINFRNYSPALRGEGYVTASLAHQAALTGDCVIRVQPDGTVDNFGITETTTQHSGFCMAKSQAGVYYLGGYYDDLNAIAAADNIAQYNGTWAACASGVNNLVRAMAIADDGTLYVGGDFTDAGTDAAADYLAKWNGSAFSAVGAGGANAAVYALAISNTGHLYAGGAFTDIASTGADYLARFDGTDWNVVVSATGLSARVNCIIPDPWGDGVIIGGQFENAGGDATIDYLARVTISGSTYAYALIGTTAPNGHVVSLHYDTLTGRLYAAGFFTSIDGISANYVAYYDGTRWNAMGAGFGDSWNSVPAGIASENGNVHFSGGIQSAGGLALADGMATWAGNQWRGQWFDTSGGTYGARGVFVDPQTSSIYWLGEIASSTAFGLTSVTNSAGGKTYPVLVVNGPGYVKGIQNVTTGEIITINGLLLKANEQLVIEFGAGGIVNATAHGTGGAPETWGRNGMPSGARDCLRYISPGSSSTITLVPGTNKIGLFVYGSTDANTAGYISYPATYRSIEGAIY